MRHVVGVPRRKLTTNPVRTGALLFPRPTDSTTAAVLGAMAARPAPQQRRKTILGDHPVCTARSMDDRRVDRSLNNSLLPALCARPGLTCYPLMAYLLH